MTVDMDWSTDEEVGSTTNAVGLEVDENMGPQRGWRRPLLTGDRAKGHGSMEVEDGIKLKESKEVGQHGGLGA